MKINKYTLLSLDTRLSCLVLPCSLDFLDSLEIRLGYCHWLSLEVTFAQSGHSPIQEIMTESCLGGHMRIYNLEKIE